MGFDLSNAFRTLVFKTETATSTDRGLRLIAKLTANFLPTLLVGWKILAKDPVGASIGPSKTPPLLTGLRFCREMLSDNISTPVFPVKGSVLLQRKTTGLLQATIFIDKAALQQ